MVFICHVTLQDHLTIAFLKVSRNPTKCGGHRQCHIVDTTILVCHVIFHVVMVM